MARLKWTEYLKWLREKAIDSQNEQEKRNIEEEVEKVFDWRNKELLISTGHFRLEGEEARKLRRHITLRDFQKLISDTNLEPLWEFKYKNDGYIKGTDERITRLGSMEIFEPVKNVYAVRVRDEIEGMHAQDSSLRETLGTCGSGVRSNMFFLEGSFPQKETVSGQQVFDFIVNNIEYIVKNEFNIGEVKINGDRLESEPIKAIEKNYEMERDKKKDDLTRAFKDSGRFHPTSPEMKKKMRDIHPR